MKQVCTLEDPNGIRNSVSIYIIIIMYGVIPMYIFIIYLQCIVVQSQWGFTGMSVRPGLDHCGEVKSESSCVARLKCEQIKYEKVLEC